MMESRERREGAGKTEAGTTQDSLPNPSKVGSQSTVYAKTLRLGLHNLGVLRELLRDSSCVLELPIGREKITVTIDSGLLRTMQGAIFGAYMEFTRPIKRNPETGEYERMLSEWAKNRAGAMILQNAKSKSGGILKQKR